MQLPQEFPRSPVLRTSSPLSIRSGYLIRRSQTAEKLREKRPLHNYKEARFQRMNTSKPIALVLLAGAFAFFPVFAQAQQPSGMTLITGCKPGHSVPGYKHPSFELRAYAHFACNSSVYVWNATAKTALVQQGSTVAYVATKYVPWATTTEEQAGGDERVFLQAIAEALRSSDASAMSARLQLVQSCLHTRGCRAEIWSNLVWTRIKKAGEFLAAPDSTLRIFAEGSYYSAFVVDPPLRFKDQPLPNVKSPVLVLDGGGLSLAVAGRSCYTLGTDGKWAAAGASAVQTAAIQ